LDTIYICSGLSISEEKMKKLLESAKNQGFLPLFILSFLLVLMIIASVLFESRMGEAANCSGLFDGGRCGVEAAISR